MSGPSKAAIVDAYMNAIRNADVSAFEALLAPDFTLTMPQPSFSARGTMDRAQAIELLTTVPAMSMEISTLRTTNTNVIENATDYVVEVNSRAKLKSGADYDNMYMVWFRIIDGKIKWCREHMDTSYAMAASS